MDKKLTPEQKEKPNYHPEGMWMLTCFICGNDTDMYVDYDSKDVIIGDIKARCKDCARQKKIENTEYPETITNDIQIKHPCPKCEGSGEIFAETTECDDHTHFFYRNCPNCRKEEEDAANS